MRYYRNTIIAASVAFALVGAAQAEQLSPLQGQTIDLGEISGVAYYTVESNGFHVVATLAETGEARAPMRFEAVLAPGQSITFSTPGGADVRPNTIEISRQNDEVLIHKAALTN